MIRNLTPKKDKLSLSNIQNRLNSMFEDFFADVPIIHGMTPMRQFPSVNVAETKNEIVIQAELPAVNKNDIKIDTLKDRIIITGEKKDENRQEESTFHLYEISYGKFQRSINLGFDINPDKVDASFSDGVLVIKVRKPEEKKDTVKTIPVH
ncbi:Putative heat shock protein [Candidatus Phycorickettsia trachydisci]|uniref:Heat shock protein n=1 Tax=Candidatus Phycorickettsia trachydisci TaxID=2115978 RepID=A0A2P1P6T2_9RICK|nr:Hsp20/alpha crystallin family protein [Candidatus Phycorickettsia trachydisci]AVP86979.1 Putative heat shock protein [Candidatus Phycorickettsia trachydisci]